MALSSRKGQGIQGNASKKVAPSVSPPLTPNELGFSPKNHMTDLVAKGSSSMMRPSRRSMAIRGALFINNDMGRCRTFAWINITIDEPQKGDWTTDSQQPEQSAALLTTADAPPSTRPHAPHMNLLLRPQSNILFQPDLEPQLHIQAAGPPPPFSMDKSLLPKGTHNHAAHDPAWL